MDSVFHIGIIYGTHSLGVESTLNQNLKKARNTLYALLGAGLNGKNAIAPRGSMNLLQIYIIPILLHGLEILLPSSNFSRTWRDKQLQGLNTFLEDTLRAIFTTWVCSQAFRVRTNRPATSTGKNTLNGFVYPQIN